MPKRPEIALAVGAMLLTACASAPGPDRARPALSPELQQVAVALPGRYVSILSRNRPGPAQALDIERRSTDNENALGLLMTQGSAGDERAARRFGLTLTAGRSAGRLDGRFAPLAADGSAIASCDMQFRLTAGRLVGATDPSQCRFGSGEAARGLLKEIAFDGTRLTVGDRIVGDDGAAEPDRIVTFLPARRYTGWLGRREGDGWRIAREIALAPDGRTLRPSDAADMSLGVDLKLAYYRTEGESAERVLRLTVLDADSGDVLGETWSEPQSDSLGLVLPDLQVGLSRVRGQE
jgi:hypothetical protein